MIEMILSANICDEISTLPESERQKAAFKIVASLLEFSAIGAVRETNPEKAMSLFILASDVDKRIDSIGLRFDYPEPVLKLTSVNHFE